MQIKIKTIYCTCRKYKRNNYPAYISFHTNISEGRKKYTVDDGKSDGNIHNNIFDPAIVYVKDG